MKGVLITLAITLAVNVAAADPVRVEIVEIAGTTAYVSPGRGGGVIAGTKIRIGSADFVVIDSTEKTAAISISGTAVHVGQIGTAEVVRDASATGVRVLPTPRVPETFVGQWNEAVLPATRQTPTVVALGAGRASTGTRMAVFVKGVGGAARDSRDGSVEGRVIASFALMQDRPLAADVDVAGRLFLAGIDWQTHAPVFVRAAQLRYGDERHPRLTIGRLRYAATSVGMLDGGRATARMGSFEAAAFGGLVPDPLGGKPDTGAARFGAEAIYDNADAAWQPRVAITAYGSTWDGAVDERRLALTTSATHESLRFDGWTELQSFPSTNTFDAKSIEVTGAGTSAQWRRRRTHLGLDVTFLKPERSRRLAAALPLEWLCTPLRVQGDLATTCGGTSSWTTADVSAGVGDTHWNVDGIGSLTHSDGVYRGTETSGYLRGELRFAPFRAEAAVSGGNASFGSWTAGELGAGVVVSRTIDVAARYRPELLDYVASTGPMLLHSIVADVRYARSAALDVSASAMATTGEDRDAVALFLLVAWRPLP